MRRKDAGSGPVTVLLMFGVVALVCAALLTAVTTVARTEGSQATYAADAAALGGAQGVLEDAPDSLMAGFGRTSDIADLLGGGSCLQTGRAKAEQLAAANGAAVTSYCWNVFRDQVTAAVRMNGTDVSGPPASADAEAATTFEARACSLDPSFDEPTPEPTPSPTGTTPPDAPPPPPPPPPRPIVTWVDCGLGRMTVEFSIIDGRFRFRDLEGDLEDVEPRLTD